MPDSEAPTESTAWSLRCVLIKNHTGACTHHTAYPNHVMLHHWHVLVNHTCSLTTPKPISLSLHTLSPPPPPSLRSHTPSSLRADNTFLDQLPPPPPHTHTHLAPEIPPHPLWDQTPPSCPHLWDPESSLHRRGGSSWQWSKRKYRQGWWAATHSAPPLCPVNTSLTD